MVAQLVSQKVSKHCQHGPCWDYSLWSLTMIPASIRIQIQLMLEFLKAPFLVLLFLYYTLMTFLICNIAIYEDTTLYSKCDQAPDLLTCELASELESDLRGTVDWVRKWLVDFSATKTQLVLFDPSNNTGAIDVRMDSLFLRKKHLLR